MKSGALVSPPNLYPPWFLLKWPPLWKYITTKESVYTRKEFHRTGLEHQQGHRFIFLENQYGGPEVMWKGSHKAVTIYSATGKTLNTWNISGMFIVLWPITAKTNARELAAKPQTNPLGWSGSEAVIRDHSDHGRTNEPTNPCPEWIYRFIWSTMIRVILIRINSKVRTLINVLACG